MRCEVGTMYFASVSSHRNMVERRMSVSIPKSFTRRNSDEIQASLYNSVSSTHRVENFANLNFGFWRNRSINLAPRRFETQKLRISNIPDFWTFELVKIGNAIGWFVTNHRTLNFPWKRGSCDDRLFESERTSKNFKIQSKFWWRILSRFPGILRTTLSSFIANLNKYWPFEFRFKGPAYLQEEICEWSESDYITDVRGI